jgi:hypothetical protein
MVDSAQRAKRDGRLALSVLPLAPGSDSRLGWPSDMQFNYNCITPGYARLSATDATRAN